MLSFVVLDFCVFVQILLRNMSLQPLLVLGSVLVLVACVRGEEPLGEKMVFETPNMSEEEQHSPHTPKAFEITCDSCTAIAYQLTKALQKAERLRAKSKQSKPLSESEVLDVFETVCEDDKIWNEYGIKTVRGTNRLSGEGLEAKEVPGMMQGGGKWPGRLTQKCSTFSGDLGEDVIYAGYRKTGDLHTFLCKEKSKDCVKKTKEEL